MSKILIGGVKISEPNVKSNVHHGTGSGDETDSRSEISDTVASIITVHEFYQGVFGENDCELSWKF